MMKVVKIVSMLGVLTAMSYAVDSTTVNGSGVAATLERIMAKAGISIDGEFRSQYLNTTITGKGADTTKRTDESAEFTSVDFDIKARPNTITQGHLIFRMYQDWRNFMSNFDNPIFTRWISIDGTLNGMFSYNAGDFRQKYTPLTLYAPDLDVLYEPDIFAKERDIAQKEVFIDNNQRMLQGVNMNFAAEIAPVFNSLQVGILGARLRDVETSIKNGDFLATAIEKSPVEKFLAASNLDLTFLKGISVGGNFLWIFDNKGSYTGDRSIIDTMAENTRIADVRGGCDVGKLINANNWKLGLNAELATSSDDSSYYRGIDTLGTTTINGNALRAGITAGFTSGEALNISLDANFLNNTSNFRNDLAQSPDFVGHRIMNVENDNWTTSTLDAHSRHYSTFDAMYRSVFKFDPSAASNYWVMAPFSKNSYTNQILTQSEMSIIKANNLDPALQLVMPFGPATPNRSGIDARATVGLLNNLLQAKLLVTSLKEIDPTAISKTQSLPTTSFSQVGGGLKIDVAGFIGWKLPFYVSSSFARSTANNDGIASDSLYPKTDFTSDFYCENLYFKFWKRAALLGGMEMINNETATAYSVKQAQLMYAAGLEYKVSEGSYVIGTIGQMQVNYTNNTPNAPDASLADFAQPFVNLSLKVLF